jgi:hypothetical protein
MTKEQTLDLIEGRIMMLAMAGAQREEDGSVVYEEKMIKFAIDALNSVYDEIEVTP